MNSYINHFLTRHWTGILMPILLSTPFASSVLGNEGGFGVGNGGGTVELEAIYLWDKIPDILSTCEFTQQCSLTVRQEEAILRATSDNRLKSSRLKFASFGKFDTQAPPFFSSEKFGQGSVLINTDYLYRLTKEQKVQPISFRALIAGLAEAAATFEGLSNAEASDLGSQITNAWHLPSTSLDLLQYRQTIRLQNLKSAKASTNLSLQVLFTDAKKVHNITETLVNQLPCPSSEAKAVSLELLENLYWEELKPRPADHLNGKALGEITYFCAGSNAKQMKIKGQIAIEFHFLFIVGNSAGFFKGDPRVSLALEADRLKVLAFNLSEHP